VTVTNTNDSKLLDLVLKSHKIYFKGLYCNTRIRGASRRTFSRCSPATSQIINKNSNNRILALSSGSNLLTAIWAFCLKKAQASGVANVRQIPTVMTLTGRLIQGYLRKMPLLSSWSIKMGVNPGSQLSKFVTFLLSTHPWKVPA
jgi:hypothetical protein